MPEVILPIELPAQRADQIYSPSTVINHFFKSGDQLSVAEFETKITEALHAASKRVKERFGFECTSAMAELDRLKPITGKINDKTSVVKIL